MVPGNMDEISIKIIFKKPLININLSYFSRANSLKPNKF